MPIEPDGGFLLAVARFCAVAALLSAFGALTFRAVVLPKVLARNPGAASADQAIGRLARWSLAGALVGLLFWGILQTNDFAHAGFEPALFAKAWPVVLAHTVFGHVLIAQLLAALSAGLLAGQRSRSALVFSAAAVLLQAGHSHAASMYDGPSVLLASDMLHLAAAGAWLGGLMPLLIVVRDAPPGAGALAARWFTPLGKACVAGLVVSAGFQFWVLIGGLPGLLGTAYGEMAMVKVALLTALLAFAVLNRYRLAPALLRGDPETARRNLIRSLTLQTAAGVATVLAAGLLSELPPSLHEQPIWPFAWRPSLDVMAEPELAGEVWLGLGLAVVALLLLASLAWRPMHRAALAVVVTAAGLGWLAWPHLTLVLVPAYPTSYYTSPTSFAATSIVQGESLYPRHCASCHGTSGRGDGPAAASLPVPPADLTADHLWAHPDGELFWWLTHGIEAPDGSLAMPGFKSTLTADRRWALIDAIRARNAGTAFQDSGAWKTPIQLPAFDLVCPAQGSTSIAALQGHEIYLVIPQPDRSAPAPARDPNTVSVLLGAADPGWTGCRASDPAAAAAIDIALGQTPGQGARVLADRNLWLRAATTADSAAWDDPAALSSAIRAIRTPLRASSAAHHHGG